MKGKRIATNSMIATAKRCRKKFVWQYVEELAPAKSARAPSFGDLFHRLVHRLLTDGLGTDFGPTVIAWRDERIGEAVAHAEQVKATLGFEDAGIVTSVEEKCDEIAEQVRELAAYYRDSVLVPEKGRYRVLWAEQRFSVPLTNRAGQRHQTWRLDGKWDVVLRDESTGRVVIRDFKTTVRQPADFATMAELDTQPVGYLYAGLYLATLQRPSLTMAEWKRSDMVGSAMLASDAIAPDAPFWPTDLGPLKGFEFEIIRKKVPKEPPLLKTGKRLSKAQNIDTTPELFRAAIARHELNEEDYAEVLDRLDHRGPAFHFRNQVNIGAGEIERWAEETRMCLEDLRVLELHPERAYRADPMTCQNQYGRRCEYHSLCFGDEELARADFIRRPRHSELNPEEEDNGVG